MPFKRLEAKAFGWVLEEFGLGNGQKNEIAAIRQQLGEIQTGLTEIRAATVQLRAEVAEGTYSDLVAQTIQITARIDKGMDDLDAIARMAADDPTKRAFTEATLKFIDDNLMQGQQEELAKRITGEAGADGLIVGRPRRDTYSEVEVTRQIDKVQRNWVNRTLRARRRPCSSPRHRVASRQPIRRARYRRTSQTR